MVRVRHKQHARYFESLFIELETNVLKLKNNFHKKFKTGDILENFLRNKSKVIVNVNTT